MAPFEKTIRQATERFYEDERLRSNFTDDESKIVLDWAQRWIASRVALAKNDADAAQIAQSEIARVRQSVTAINTLAAKPGALTLAEAVAALQPQVQAASVMPREQVFKLVTELLSAMWQLQEQTSRGKRSRPSK